jgi:hypothetical protein
MSLADRFVIAHFVIVKVGVVSTVNVGEAVVLSKPATNLITVPVCSPTVLSDGAIATLIASEVPVTVPEYCAAPRYAAFIVLLTKAVVANLVVLLLTVCVGAVGLPKNAGDDRLAFKFSADCKSVWLDNVPVIAPHVAPPPPAGVAQLLLPDESP